MLRLDLLFHCISDVEEEFDCIHGTLEVTHQKRQLRELCQEISQVKRDDFLLEVLLPHESVGYLVLRKDNDVREG